MKLLVRASTNPVVRLEPGKAVVHANGTVTAYAIQANGTLIPLFILNLVGGFMLAYFQIRCYYLVLV